MGIFSKQALSKLLNWKNKESKNEVVSDESNHDWLKDLINNSPVSIDMTGTSEMEFGIFDEYETEEIKEKIRDYRRIDLEKASMEEVEDALKKIIPSNICNSILLNDQVDLYRARYHVFEEKNMHNVFGQNKYNVFEEESQVWLRKALHITELGRINGYHDPIFYLSFDAITPIHEIRSKKEDQFALMKYGLKKGQSLSLSLIAIEDYRDIGKRFGNYAKWSEKGRQNWELMNKFMSDEFTRKVGDDEKYLYKTTVTLKKLFDFSGCDGFIYPSIERKGKYNVALKEKAIKKLRFVGLTYWINNGYNKVKLKKDDLMCAQCWSNKISYGRIEYHTFKRCPIEFNGLNISKDRTIYTR